MLIIITRLHDLQSLWYHRRQSWWDYKCQLRAGGLFVFTCMPDIRLCALHGEWSMLFIKQMDFSVSEFPSVLFPFSILHPGLAIVPLCSLYGLEAVTLHGPSMTSSFILQAAARSGLCHLEWGLQILRPQPSSSGKSHNQLVPSAVGTGGSSPSGMCSTILSILTTREKQGLFGSHFDSLFPFFIWFWRPACCLPLSLGTGYLCIFVLFGTPSIIPSRMVWWEAYGFRSHWSLHVTWRLWVSVTSSVK